MLHVGEDEWIGMVLQGPSRMTGVGRYQSNKGGEQRASPKRRFHYYILIEIGYMHRRSGRLDSVELGF